MSKSEFQRMALGEFRRKVISWSGDGNVGPAIIDDISDICRIISDLASIGRYVIVDYTSSSSFDNFSACYKKGDYLYIAWYEAADRFKVGFKHSRYLKFKPAKMLINAMEEPRLNHIVIDTNPIQQIVGSEVIERADEDGIQNIVDTKGEELKNLAPGEISHVFDVVCMAGRIVLHPKGSILSREKRDYYFNGYRG